MSKIALAEDGLTISRVVPGVMRLLEWGLSAPALLDWIKTVMDMGLTTFDHADIYGSYEVESAFGAALALEPSLREQMQLITKCGIAMLSENRPEHLVKHYNTTSAYIVNAAERSLTNLKTDYLDLLLIHRPDPLMDADVVAEAFGRLRRSGKVRHVGVSNFTPAQFDLLQSRLDYPLVTNQVEFSVMHMAPLTDGTFDQMQRLRISPMVWSPLGGGGIFHPQDEQTTRLNATLQQIGEELDGAAIDQVALAWVLAVPVNAVPVVGTGKLDRLRGAVAAMDLKMTRQQWFRIWEASAGHPVA